MNHKKTIALRLFATIVIGAVLFTSTPVEAQAKSKRTKKTQKPKVTATQAAPAQAQQPAQPIEAQPTEPVVVAPITGNALLPLTAETEGAQIIMAYQELITGSETVINETGKPLEMLSMAGGLEMLSSRAVQFDPATQGVTWNTVIGSKNKFTPVKVLANDTAREKARKAWKNARFVEMAAPVTEVLNGRSLRDAETIAAVYAVNGYYYVCPTKVDANSVTVTVPKLYEELAPVVTFFIARSPWDAGAGVDYLAIGNSITMHPKREFWPNAMGMGATSIEKDYFHIVTATLAERYAAVPGGFHSMAMNYAIWENDQTGRRSDLSLLDQYLSKDLDIVSIQLGENFLDVQNFATEYTILVQYVRQHCPNAQIILVGNYWQNDAYDMVKRQLAAGIGGEYVDLVSIQNSKKYQFGEASAADANGVMHIFSNPGTSIHPNNAAMTFIADGVLAAIH